MRFYMCRYRVMAAPEWKGSVMRNITKLAMGAAMVLSAATAAVAPASAREDPSCYSGFNNYSSVYCNGHSGAYARNDERNREWAQQRRQEIQRYANRNQHSNRVHSRAWRNLQGNQYDNYRQRG
jgi:Spy/CpxP family protein refolding chaperone